MSRADRADAKEEKGQPQQRELLCVYPFTARELVFRFPTKLKSGKEVKLTVTLPHGYPDGCPRIQAEGIDPRSPHRWSNGDLCVFGVMSSWNPGKHTVFSTLQLGRQWLCRYDEWMSTGVWGKKENV